jgi:hypothetical protein
MLENENEHKNENALFPRTHNPNVSKHVLLHEDPQHRTQRVAQHKNVHKNFLSSQKQNASNKRKNSRKTKMRLDQGS